MAKDAPTVSRVSRERGSREVSVFCGVRPAQTALRYGMSGNEAATANPLCQVLRALFSTSPCRKRGQLEAQPPHPKPAPCSDGARVSESRWSCISLVQTDHHHGTTLIPSIYSLSKASSHLCLDHYFQLICSFQTASPCLYTFVAGYVSYRYRSGVI